MSASSGNFPVTSTGISGNNIGTSGNIPATPLKGLKTMTTFNLKTLAQTLSVSERTVFNHRTSIEKRYGVGVVTKQGRASVVKPEYLCLMVWSLRGQELPESLTDYLAGDAPTAEELGLTGAVESPVIVPDVIEDVEADYQATDEPPMTAAITLATSTKIASFDTREAQTVTVKSTDFSMAETQVNQATDGFKTSLLGMARMVETQTYEALKMAHLSGVHKFMSEGMGKLNDLGETVQTE